jgi:fermentation-respiration switch protein FrsA (DUF1100 family)
VAPFESVQTVVNEKFGLLGKLLVKERFDNLTKARHLRTPALLIHGDQDDVVPISHSYNIYSMFGSRRKHQPGALLPVNN